MSLHKCKRCGKDFSSITDEIYCSFECAYAKFGDQNTVLELSKFQCYQNDALWFRSY
jgi:hypothetical protein